MCNIKTMLIKVNLIDKYYKIRYNKLRKINDQIRKLGGKQWKKSVY